MSNDWRYKFQHAGDLFVGMFEATVYAARRSAANIVIDYQVNNLGRKKDKVATQIGNRVVEMRKDSPELLTYDPQISDFYEELDLLQERIDERLDEKQEMQERWDSLLNRFTPNCEFDETCDEDMSSRAV
jgi:hypothetical protein